MNRRKFFRFLRDGGVALGLAALFGVPKMKESDIFDDIKAIATPKDEAIEKLSEALATGVPDVPVYNADFEFSSTEPNPWYPNPDSENDFDGIAEFMDAKYFDTET